MKELLLWTDLETAGTEENIDPILEIACVVTAGPEFTELTSFESVIRPSNGVVLARSRSAAAVQRMHDTNGLWDACTKGKMVGIVETELIVRISAYGDPGDFVLAGSGVSHFDRRFINAQLPTLAGWLKYWSIDVGGLRRSLRLVGRGDLVPDLDDHKPHRAMADIRLHIEEMKHYRKVLSTRIA